MQRKSGYVYRQQVKNSQQCALSCSEENHLHTTMHASRVMELFIPFYFLFNAHLEKCARFCSRKANKQTPSQTKENPDQTNKHLPQKLQTLISSYKEFILMFCSFLFFRFNFLTLSYLKRFIKGKGNAFYSLKYTK